MQCACARVESLLCVRVCVCARVRISLWSLDTRAPLTRQAGENVWGLGRRRRRSEPLTTDKDRLWSCLVRRLFRAFPLAASAGPPENIARPSVSISGPAAVTMYAAQRRERL